jgi:hypothetical protein
MNKKYIIALIIAVIFSNCDISPRKAKASNDSILCVNEHGACVQQKFIMIDNMKYMITAMVNSGNTVTNITKDSLECEYYRKQLKGSGHE